MADSQQKGERTLIDPAIARVFLIERFADFLALEQGSSPRTSEAYRRDVERLAIYATAKGARVPTDISSRLLREFV
jgi:site-specific recombinase XerC